MAANNILLMRKRNHAFLLLVIVFAWKWQPRIFIKKQIRLSNDKTIIELGYRKISWFVTVSQMSYWLATYKSRYFAQTLSKNCLVNCFYLTPAMAALSPGCEPRINVFDMMCYRWVFQPCVTVELFLYVTHFIFCFKLQLTT